MERAWNIIRDAHFNKQLHITEFMSELENHSTSLPVLLRLIVTWRGNIALISICFVSVDIMRAHWCLSHYTSSLHVVLSPDIVFSLNSLDLDLQSVTGTYTCTERPVYWGQKIQFYHIFEGPLPSGFILLNKIPTTSHLSQCSGGEDS